MAKEHYRWRYSLDASRMDVQISIKSNNGVGTRPIPIRFVVAVIASFLACFWIVQVSPLLSMGVGWTVLFCVFWLIASVVLLKPDKSGHLAFEKLPTLLDYIPRSSRYVTTRSTSPAWNVLNVTGIENIDPENGIITFNDGDVGLLYRVTGSASCLLFKHDCANIIDRVESFWRNMSTDYEITFVTMIEPQKVDRQIRAMDMRIENLKKDPDMAELLQIAQYERDLLANEIGVNYKSRHQYMLVKAANRELLARARNAVANEAQQTNLMFKRVQSVYDTDDTGKLNWELTDVFATIFGPLPESEYVHLNNNPRVRSVTATSRGSVKNYGSHR